MKSMTGYGSGELSYQHYHFHFEIKTVNHRFLDVQFRLPREFLAAETELRQVLKSQLQRGRVEVWLTVTKDGADAKTLEINWELLDQLVFGLETARQERYQGRKFEPQQLMAGLVNQEAFFQVKAAAEEVAGLDEALVTTLNLAIEKLNYARGQEGQMIQEVLRGYLADVTDYVAALQALSQVGQAEHVAKLSQKLNDWLGDLAEVEESRLLTEAALLLERGDINEELDRLVIHCQKFSQLLVQDSAVGREMDFMLQEMNREVNTIGSKSSAMAIKELVVALKTTLEKIREQIQNVE